MTTGSTDGKGVLGEGGSKNVPLISSNAGLQDFRNLGAGAMPGPVLLERNYGVDIGAVQINHRQKPGNQLP